MVHLRSPLVYTSQLNVGQPELWAAPALRSSGSGLEAVVWRPHTRSGSPCGHTQVLMVRRMVGRGVPGACLSRDSCKGMCVWTCAQTEPRSALLLPPPSSRLPQGLWTSPAGTARLRIRDRERGTPPACRPACGQEVHGTPRCSRDLWCSAGPWNSCLAARGGPWDTPSYLAVRQAGSDRVLF